MTSPENEFWRWFEANETSLFDFEGHQERIFTALTEELQRVHPDLTFELSVAVENGVREFVISADGIRDAFPAVEALHAAAPALPRWRWIRFRPRRGPSDIQIADRVIRAEDVRYVLYQDEEPGKLGILLFMEGYTEEEHNLYGQVGFLMLDGALGEYDVETRVGGIDIDSPASKYFAQSLPLEQLPRHFDQAIAAV